MGKRKMILWSVLAVIFFVGLDQLTKYLAIIYLKDKPSIDILKNVFCLQYLENQGAAFGILQNQMIFFIISTILIIILIAVLFVRMSPQKYFWPLRLCMIFVCAGAIGNFIDRIRFGYVVDFLYFELIDFPIFNVADIYVTLSAISLCILLLFVYKDEDLDCIFAKKGKK